jgi:hypothetical protein
LRFADRTCRRVVQERRTVPRQNSASHFGNRPDNTRSVDDFLEPPGAGARRSDTIVEICDFLIRWSDPAKPLASLDIDYRSSGPTWYDAFAKPDLVSPGHNIVATLLLNGASQAASVIPQ